MTKLFHRLSTRIVLEILLAVAVSAAIYAGANAALTRFFQQYATEPAVFRRLSDRHFQDLQRFADENHLVSTDGKPFTQWNDRYHYVSLMIIRQNEALCYNSFVSYNMTYTEEDQEHFYWGSKVLPTYEYRLRLADETCKVYFSGYFDQAYTSLRKGICAGLFLISFVAGFYLLFQKHIRYIEEMEQNVSSLCSKNFSRQIPIRGSTELSTLAANINHLGDTIQLLLLTEDAKLKQKEQFVKSIAHDIRTPLTVVIGYLELLSKGYAGSPESAALFIDRALEKTNHIRRLRDGQCTVYAGLVFLDILINAERIADQCSNLGVYTISQFDPSVMNSHHEYIHRLHQGNDPVFNREYQEKHEKYFGMLSAIND